MAKFVPTSILDLMLDQAEGTKIHICTSQPTTFAEANDNVGSGGFNLASATIVGSYTAAAGDVSGRKNTLPAQTTISIAVSGTALHVAVTDGTSVLKMVTTCTSQALVSGGTVDTNAIAHEVQQAA